MLHEMIKSSGRVGKPVTLKRFLYLSMIPLGLLVISAAGLSYMLTNNISEHTDALARHAVSNALIEQRGALKLEGLRYSLYTLVESPNRQRARENYINAWKLISESAVDRHDETRESMNALLESMREVWHTRQKYDDALDFIRQKALSNYSDLLKAAAYAPNVEKSTLPEIDLAVIRTEYRTLHLTAYLRQFEALESMFDAICVNPRTGSADRQTLCLRTGKNMRALDEKIAELPALRSEFDQKIAVMVSQGKSLRSEFSMIQTSELVGEIKQINKITDPALPIFLLLTGIFIVISGILIHGYFSIIKPLMVINDDMKRFLTTGVMPNTPMSRIVEINDSIAWFSVFCKLLNQNREDRQRIESKYSELVTESTMDPLTGVENRKALRSYISEHGKPASRTRALMIDIDHFKQINDTRGHLFGDKILEQLGRQLKDGISENDCIFRFGGEEFCVIMPDTSEDKSRKVAARLLRMARQISRQDATVHPTNAKNQPLTISIGMSSLTKSDGETSFKELIHEADTALYAAKETGRDRFCTFHEKMSERPDGETANRNE